jgi:hypothetical protein
LQSRLGLYHGKTRTMEELLEEMSTTKLNEWRGTVHGVFAEGTADELAIFPQDRKPFQKGTYQQRIEAVHTLSTTLGDYTTKPALVALAAVVLAYYTMLNGSRLLQETDEGSTDSLRTNLKTALRLLCNALYHNLGLLMAKFSDTPLTVADYFDTSMLMHHDDNGAHDFDGSILGSTIFNLNPLIDAEGLTLSPTSIIRMKVLGAPTNSLIFYSTMAAFNPPGPGVQFTVSGGSTLEKTFAEMGFATFPFFNIQNPTAFEIGWEIEIIP